MCTPHRVRIPQHWELLPLQATMHLRVGLECQGHVSGFPTFPLWFGKNSAAMKRRRLVAEINTHMNARCAATSGLSALQQLVRCRCRGCGRAHARRRRRCRARAAAAAARAAPPQRHAHRP
jgi:Replication factor RFC1 C terminal domain